MRCSQPQESPYKSVFGCRGVVEHLARRAAEETVEVRTLLLSFGWVVKDSYVIKQSTDWNMNRLMAPIGSCSNYYTEKLSAFSCFCAAWKHEKCCKWGGHARCSVLWNKKCCIYSFCLGSLLHNEFKAAVINIFILTITISRGLSLVLMQFPLA